MCGDGMNLLAYLTQQVAPNAPVRVYQEVASSVRTEEDHIIERGIYRRAMEGKGMMSVGDIKPLILRSSSTIQCYLRKPLLEEGFVTCTTERIAANKKSRTLWNWVDGK